MTCGAWDLQKLLREQAAMRLRWNKKTQSLLEKALRRLEKTEAAISRLPVSEP